MKKILTLCLICKDSKVLLAMKKERLGVGRWNGFGGKVEEGETIEEAAKREVLEECGVRVNDIEKAGVINFSFQEDPKELEVHVFRCGEFDGEIIESEEMGDARWFDENELPLDQMWTADTFWLPMLVKGKKFKGRFLYDRPSTAEYASKILDMELRELE